MGFESPPAVHRWLLRLYPRAFRRQHGEQILTFWCAQRAEARYERQLLGPPRYWVDIVRDALGNGLRQRWNPSRYELDRLNTQHPAMRAKTAAPALPVSLPGGVDLFLQDLRFARRSLLRQPVFTSVAIVTLAVGIGSATAVFSIVDTVLFRPLPYEKPEELVRLGRLSATGNLRSLALPEVKALAQLAAFTAVAPTLHYSTDMQFEEFAEVVAGASAGSDMFEVLGVAPVLGRMFTADEELPGGPPVVLISERLWHRHFAGTADAVGRTVGLDGEPHVIVGVMPDRVTFPEPGIDFWTPFRDGQVVRDLDLNPDTRDLVFFDAVGRLGTGVTVVAAQREVGALFERLNAEEEREENRYEGAAAALHEATVGGSRAGLLLFLGAVGLVFLIACANVAGLWLTRIAARSTEVAVRSALGAGKRRIVAQLLTESVALAAVAGLGGIVVALGLQRGLLAIVPSTIPRLEGVGIDGRVLLFAVGLAVLAAAVFGALPALRAAGRSSGEILRGSGRGTPTGKVATQQILVVGQIAITVVLLAGAGLLANSYSRLVNVDLGARQDGLIVARLSPRIGDQGTEAIRNFYAALLPRVDALPGVSRSAFTYSPPMGQSNFRQSVHTETMAEDEDGVWAGTVIISPNYLELAGVPLVRGRSFSDTDVLGAPHVVIVNESMASELWPGEEPLGKRFRWAHGLSGSLDSFEEEFFPSDWMTVVGVAGDVRRRDLSLDPEPEYYRPHAQMSWPSMALLIETQGENPNLAADLRRAVADIDPMVPMSQVRSLRQTVAASVSEPRFRVMLVGGFALLACLLAMLGVYAVMVLTVTRRTHDIGIRMALGAERSTVRRQVVMEGMRMAMAGTAIGLVAALSATELVAAMLYGVEPTDPLTFGLVILITLAVAGCACYLPARRASRLDPLAALRTD